MKKIYLSITLFAFTLGFAQRSEKELHSVAASACECVAKISVDLEEVAKNDSIRSCINTSNLVSLMKASMLSKSAGNSNVINASENYEDIQANLREYCPAFKNLIQSNNKKFNKSHSANEKAMKKYKEGQDFDQRQNYSKAIKAYQEAVKIDPEFAFAWDNLGKAYRMDGQYQKAIDCYKKSLALDPDGTMPRQNMAVAQELLKDYDGAIKTFTEYAAKYPEDPEAYYGLGRMYFAKDNYENALDNMFKANTLYKKIGSPYASDAEANLAVLYKKLKELNQLDLFMKVAKANNIEIGE